MAEEASRRRSGRKQSFHLVSVAIRVTRFGEISAYGRLFSLGIFLKNTRNGLHIWATFPHSIDYELNLTKKRLGNILGDFLTNSSGHPGGN
jgi:hypothetical protein